MEDFLRSTKLRQLREADIEAKQLVLKRAWMSTSEEEDRKHLDEMFETLTQEWLFLRKRKQWIFNFIGGGWNTIMGADKEEAINNAKEEWKNFKTLNVDDDSFRLSTSEDYKTNLASFH